MDIVEHSDPWQHYTIDDVLRKTHFGMIQTLTSRWQKPQTSKEKFNLCLDDFKFYRETAPFYNEAMVVKKVLYKLMQELEVEFSLEGKFKSYQIEYVNCGNDFYYPVHKDSTAKVFTNVLYVSQNGDGTRLYKDKDGQPEKLVDWKENRIVSFKPDSHTWHDYYSTHSGRITFNLVFVKFNISLDKPMSRVETDLTRI